MESFKFARPIFVVCQFFTGSWRRNFVGWLVGGGGVKGKITLGKFILFETSYLSLQRSLQRDCYTTSTIKLLHANWVINTHYLMSQRPELIKSGFRKEGLLQLLIIDTFYSVHA